MSAPGQGLGLALAELFSRRVPGMTPLLARVVQTVAERLAAGDVCLPLAPWCREQELDLAEVQAALAASPLVGTEQDFTPLVLDGERVYLRRYFAYEVSVAAHLQRLAKQPVTVTHSAALRACLDGLFAAATESPDWQKAAAAAALIQGLCLISGGPGTGKTTTVVKLLAALQALAPDRLLIKLAAPTGKAAARMSEAIKKARDSLGLTPAQAEAIPTEAATLHRLLGTQGESSQFRHHAANPLPLDVLVVDEASMIDLALMAKLLDALPSGARLILLGDKDQLDPVDAGRVFGALCALREYDAPFAQRLLAASGVAVQATVERACAVGRSVMTLCKTYRFDDKSGIGALARAVNQAQTPVDAEDALALARAGRFADLLWQEGPFNDLLPALSARVALGYQAYADAVRSAAEPAALFKALEAFRVLTPLREGPAGLRRLNTFIEQALNVNFSGDNHYPGRPVMVTANDYGQQLFNGDIGITLRQADGALSVVFPGSQGGWRYLSPARLPAHETAFAMTVHKSQGSEFDDVLLLWPDEDVAVMNKALIYTAITRARKTITLWGAAAPLAHAILRQTSRHSGLTERLKS